MTTATLRKKAAAGDPSVVVLPLKEYRRLIAASVPVVQLKGKAARDLDNLVEKSLREYHAGKTIRAASLSEALAAQRSRAKKPRNAR